MNDKELYAAIAKEAKESNFYQGKTVEKDTHLYRFVERMANKVGVPMKDIVITVIEGDNTVSAFMGYGELKITRKALTNSNLRALEGMIKHELGHRLQERRAPIAKLMDLFSGFDGSKTKECEADFVAGRDFLEYLNIAVNQHESYGYFNQLDNSHPKQRDRIKALLIKTYIEDKTGVAMRLTDVKISSDCQFEINPEKAKSIPSGVLQAAEANAEDVLRNVDKQVKEKRKDQSLTIPPIPLIAKKNPDVLDR